MPRPKALHRTGWRVAGLFVTLLAVVAVSYLGGPHVVRWRTLGRLTSDDPDLRQGALNYVARFASQDERVRRGAVARLGVGDTQKFLAIAAALDSAGIWQRPPISDGPWLRWLKVIASEPDAEARILAAQLAADLDDLADDQRIALLVRDLLNDSEADVRYNALVAAAELRGAAQDVALYDSLVRSVANDPEPGIARHAWIFLGLVREVMPVQAPWRGRPAEVAEAVLWACLKTDPNKPSPALEAMAGSTSPQRVGDAAAYALSLSTAPAAEAALFQLARTPPHQINTENQIRIWRAILGLPRRAQAEQAFWRLLQEPASPADLETRLLAVSDVVEPILLSAAYRGRPKLSLPRPSDDRQNLLLLALLESSAAAIDPDQPTIATKIAPMELEPIRLAAAIAGPAADPDTLNPLFSSPLATTRDRACVVAAQQLSEKQNANLVQSLLTDFDDRAKESGSILSGLTGLEVDLLQRRADAEDVPQVAQIMKLGLWMQGRQPQLGQRVSALLTRDDLPTTTILLAMLHKGSDQLVEALDFLLQPRAEAPADLVTLLDQHRWWLVLRTYLGAVAEGVPPFWVWADPQLEAFQVDVIRDWYLLNRRRLMKS